MERRPMHRLGVLAFPVLSAALLLIAVACGSDEPTATPTLSPTATLVPGGPSSPTPTPDALAVFEAEWDALIVAAQEETAGETITIMRVIRGCTGPLAELFEQEFDISLRFEDTSVSTVADRVLAEMSAGRLSIDFSAMTEGRITDQLAPGGALDEFEPYLFHPGVIDKSQWFGGRYFWRDVEEKYGFMHGANVEEQMIALAYNRAMFSPADITSYWDLLKPEFASMIVAGGLGRPSGGYLDAYNHPDLGPDFVRQLVESPDITFTADTRLAVDGLLAGRYGIGIFLPGGAQDSLTLLQLISPDNFPVLQTGFEEEGLPTLSVKERGILRPSSHDASLAIFKNPPHPNFTKLFVNWFLTHEIQTFRNECLDAARPPQPSMREGIPIGNVLPAAYRDPGKEYAMLTGTAELNEARGVAHDAITAWWQAR
ncbi:MAG: extracellular solute-binding protein [Gemmatimonadetes bacterium]|nr:extracellular solute-binding protein [Gemmatimonadota bacterium]